MSIVKILMSQHSKIRMSRLKKKESEAWIEKLQSSVIDFIKNITMVTLQSETIPLWSSKDKCLVCLVLMELENLQPSIF